MITLTKLFIVIWNDDKQILVKDINNINTYHGDMYYSAQFDTQEELDQFILDNELIEETTI